MALDFSKIDKTVDLKGLQADVEEAKKNGGGDFPTIPAGKYEVRVETLEVKGTKADGRPMLSVSFKILSGEKQFRHLDQSSLIHNKSISITFFLSDSSFIIFCPSTVPQSPV